MIAEVLLAATLLCGRAHDPILSPSGPVTTPKQAIALAMRAASSIYGAGVESERPFRAAKRGEVWEVHGSLPSAQPGHALVGGIVEVRIKAADGTVTEICHGE